MNGIELIEPAMNEKALVRSIMALVAVPGQNVKAFLAILPSALSLIKDRDKFLSEYNFEVKVRAKTLRQDGEHFSAERVAIDQVDSLVLKILDK